MHGRPGAIRHGPLLAPDGRQRFARWLCGQRADASDLWARVLDDTELIWRDELCRARDLSAPPVRKTLADLNSRSLCQV